MRVCLRCPCVSTSAVSYLSIAGLGYGRSGSALRPRSVPSSRRWRHLFTCLVTVPRDHLLRVPKHIYPVDPVWRRFGHGPAELSAASGSQVFCGEPPSVPTEDVLGLRKWNYYNAAIGYNFLTSGVYGAQHTCNEHSLICSSWVCILYGGFPFPILGVG